MRFLWLGVIVLFALFLATGMGYGATTNYVDAARPDDSGDGTSWATAKKTIQAAVDISIDSDTVLVTNGTYDSNGAVTPGYALTNRVCVTNAITLHSVNGANMTIIKGTNATGGGCGADAVRCMYLTNASAVLIGFTLTNGYTMTNGDLVYDQSGGGFLISKGAGSNCVLAGNTANNVGGGVFLRSSGTMTNCTLVGNTASNAGGAYFYWGGVMNNCTLTGNTATNYGGGAQFRSGGIMNNCSLTGNMAKNAAGAYLLYDGCTMKNCLLAGNTATNYGGGAYLQEGGIMTNCTLAGNTAVNRGGGVYFAAGSYFGTAMVHNCIIWGNTHASSSNVYMVSTAVVNYTCSGPAQLGTGNIEFDPRFVNANGGNYRLTVDSPCVNTGQNQNWMTNSYDLDGRIRIRYGIVDMGAYEGIYNGTIWRGW